MDDTIKITLARLRDDFISRLPDRLALPDKLLTAIKQGETEAIAPLHREAHSLVGAAGVHRIMNVSDAARKLERIAAEIPTDKAAGIARTSAMRQALAHLATLRSGRCRLSGRSF